MAFIFLTFSKGTKSKMSYFKNNFNNSGLHLNIAVLFYYCLKCLLSQYYSDVPFLTWETGLIVMPLSNEALHIDQVQNHPCSLVNSLPITLYLLQLYSLLTVTLCFYMYKIHD